MVAEQAVRPLTMAGRVALVEEEITELRAAVRSLSVAGRAEDCGLEYEAGLPGPGGISRCPETCCAPGAGAPAWLGLYLLARRERADYDEVAGFVVAAATEEGAREAAAAEASYEGRATWLAPALTSCSLIGEAVRGLTAQVLLRDA